MHVAALVVQTGLRAMAAHKEFRFKKQTKAATTIQVCNIEANFILIPGGGSGRSM